MSFIPLWLQLLSLAVLILLSAFFAMTETALMAVNRHHLRHLARHGNTFAISTLWLLGRSNKLLSIVLIANTVVNTLITVIMTALAIDAYGSGNEVLVSVSAIVAFLLIVFTEISPKIIGANYPERIALPASVILRPLLIVGQPAIWFVSLFVNVLLRLAKVDSSKQIHEHRLSPEELRSIVQEDESFVADKHKSILLNLFDLEKISVSDVMTPRSHVEALNLSMPIEEIKQQLATCYHNKLPVYEGEINRIIGILHVRKAIALLNQHELTVEHFRHLLNPPYFVPADTEVLTQLQYFQENRKKFGIVVDEYGEVQGLVTMEDILEEVIGEFTTSRPGNARADTFGWDENSQCLLEGSTTLRDINKRLKLSFPLDGPKTLNGLLLEYLQDIPEANVCLKLPGCILEVVETKDQSIKIVKLIRNFDNSHVT